MESFDSSVGTSLIESCAELINVKKTTNLPHNTTVHLISIVRQQSNRHPKATKHLLNKHSCYNSSFFIWKRKCFNPLCENINTSQDIHRSTRSTIMRPSQIDAHALKRSASNDWL